MKKVSKLLFLGGIVALNLSLQSCKKDEPVAGNSVSIITIPNVSGASRSSVDIVGKLEDGDGIDSVKVMLAGKLFDAVDCKGATTYDYKKSFAIPDTSTGVKMPFTFTLKDKKGVVSTPKTVEVIVSKGVTILKGNIVTDTRLTADNIYKLVGYVKVGREDVAGTISNTAILTIEPGTVIVGERLSKGTLIVLRGSKIIADGTADKPIVFTSDAMPGARRAGDWGGLVICGKAPNNLPLASRELEGAYGAFHGGDDVNDNSGILRYVRVEYAGIPINTDQEVNSFSFGSVGAGTIIENLQASYGNDDSFEWFGGTVNCKNLISYKCIDDDFDTDNGYSGKIQFAIAIRDKDLADKSGSNGFESDNDKTGSTSAPMTSATFANVTLVGPKATAATEINGFHQNGIQLRRSSKLKVYNALITGFRSGVYVDSQVGGQTKVFAATGELVLKNIVLAGVDGFGANGYGAVEKGFGNPVVSVEQASKAEDQKAILIGEKAPIDWFTAITGNVSMMRNATLGLNDNLWLAGRPTFLLPATATQLLNVALPTTLDPWFTRTTYVGAFGTTNDWTEKWASFDPQNFNYLQ
ncbi:MAG: Ig-like domain repeat protein [Pseudarcicella sp.]|nr:Ig-like domain repeat protein [Pseudarcicella sp.]